MAILADRINQLSESQTIKMARIGREIAALGHDVINLSLGEPDFPTPKFIKEAAKKAIDEGYTFYTPIAGYSDLRQTIAEKFKRDNDLDYSADQIVVSTGAKQSISNVVMSLINPGDEVIVPQPYWVSYIEIIKLAGGKTVLVNSGIEKDFKITPEQLREAITPKTRMFIFSSPCNPTGSVYTREELSAFADIFKDHPEIWVLSDEIYEHINFLGRHESIAQFQQIKDQVIIVNGVSKGYAMTGWRIGYIGAPRVVAQACDKMQGQFTSGTSSISQRAALAALKGDLGPTLEMKQAFLRRRDLIIRLLSEVKGIKLNRPQGAFYIFPDISHYFGKSDGEKVIRTAGELCMYILHSAHVSVVTGEAFGAPDCIRISYAASDEKIVEAVKRIGKALNRLQ
jgi:aspartate aminotransferase